MGHSAKLHKRVKKTASTSSAKSAVVAPAPQPKAQQSQSSKAGAKKKNGGLKAKAAASSSRSRTDGGHVLGGADYVDLMMGGRRRAKAEAAKLPVGDS